MQGGASRVCLLCLVAILLVALYPALFLGYRIGPEASLKSAPPWRDVAGPLPKPSAEALEAATHLGPRLAGVARAPLAAALWNPWIGGGRAGWLSGAQEGGSPLVLLAATAARPGWAWTALLALELAVAWIGGWWALRLLGLGAWPAATGATAYALSGAATGHWLDWQGSAFALGPLALVAALAAPRRWPARAAAWALALVLLGTAGAPALQFVALGAAAAVLLVPRRPERRAWLAAGAAVALALAAGLPRLWVASHAGETGAASTASAAPAVTDWTAAVTMPRVPDRPPGGAEALVYVGLGTAALAALGLLTAPPRARGFWLGVGGVTALAVWAPAPWLARLGLWQRPHGVLALAAATLAAYGAQRLTDRLSGTHAAGAAGFAAWALISLSLLPAAVRHLPFVPAEETVLAAPIPGGEGVPPWRLVGVMGAMPPDSAALLGLADVRAGAFPGEPAYAALVGGGRTGEVPLSRALDPAMARLGVRWLLEPLPLRVVSGEVFSRIEQVEAEPEPLDRERSALRLRVVVPTGATRLGLELPSAATAARLDGAAGSSRLEPDAALQAESSTWTWFGVPPGVAPGPATLVLSPGRDRPAHTVTVAWDTSGLLLASEHRGVRVWECAGARPFAFLARAVRAAAEARPTEPDIVTVPADRLRALGGVSAGVGGRVAIERLDPGAVAVRASTPAPALVVLLVKYRPGIWRARVDGAPAPVVPADGVWTAVPVPAGESRVELAAGLPGPAWAASAAAFAAIALMAVVRRRT